MSALQQEAVDLTAAAIGNAQRTKGDQHAYDLAVAYLCAYGVVLRQLLGPEHAAEHIYKLADTIVTHGGSAQ